MRVEVLPPSHSGDLEFVSGRVSWEDSGRKDRVLYAGAPAGTFRQPNTAHWLLLSVIHSAVRHGERRVAIEGGAVDPALLRSLCCALAQYDHWFGGGTVPIEAEIDSGRPVSEDQQRCTAAFFSGGVDSLGTIVRNRADFAREHPWAVDDAILIDWMGPSSPDELDGRLTPQHVYIQQLMDRLSGPLDITLVPIVTNIRRLEHNDFYYDWMFRDNGAGLASLAHVLDGRIGRAMIASTYDLASLGPLGSHPLIDPWYGSSTVQIVHDSPDQSRLEKMRMLVDRPELLATLNVCSFWFQRAPGEPPNCGECEKCLRTRVGLEALGVDTAALPTFAPADLLAGIRAREYFDDDYARACWADTVEPLTRRGDHQLARAVAHFVENAPMRNPFVAALAGGSRS